MLFGKQPAYIYCRSKFTLQCTWFINIYHCRLCPAISRGDLSCGPRYRDGRDRGPGGVPHPGPTAGEHRPPGKAQVIYLFDHSAIQVMEGVSVCSPS